MRLFYGMGNERLAPALIPVPVLAGNNRQGRRLFNIASNRYLMASEPDRKRSSAGYGSGNSDVENKGWAIAAAIVAGLASIYLFNKFVIGFDFFNQADRQHVARDFARVARENWGVIGAVVKAIGGFWVLAPSAIVAWFVGSSIYSIITKEPPDDRGIG